MELNKLEELKRLGILTPDELKEQELRMRALEETATNDIAKYFDRINDKLFGLTTCLLLVTLL